MTRLIKKYKNRRLYDTQISQYITLEQLQGYILEGIDFKIEDSKTSEDLTKAVLLQVIVEMEAGPTQFLSSEVLRHIIVLANHPLQDFFKSVMQNLFQEMNKPLESNSYQKASKQWNEQVQGIMNQWQSLLQKIL